MLRKCKAVKTKRNEYKIKIIMATRDLRLYFTSVSKDKKASHGSCTSIPQLVKATGNVTAADVSAVNAELESFSKKKERQGSSRAHQVGLPSSP